MGKLPLNLFQIRDTCYSQLINSGLAVLKDNKLQEFVSRDKLIGNDVIAGFPYGEDAMLLFMRNNGVFLHKNDNSISKWTIACEKELERYTINRVIQTKDSCYIVGTISNGIYAFNKNGHLLWKINTDRGMSNNTVLGLCCDTDNNIWAVLDDGIAYIQSNSLVYYYEPVHRKIGMVYDILVKDKEAYIASNQGLYYLMVICQNWYLGWKSKRGLLMSMRIRYFVAIIRELFLFQKIKLCLCPMLKVRCAWPK